MKQLYNVYNDYFDLIKEMDEIDWLTDWLLIAVRHISTKRILEPKNIRYLIITMFLYMPKITALKFFNEIENIYVVNVSCQNVLAMNIHRNIDYVGLYDIISHERNVFDH